MARKSFHHSITPTLHYSTVRSLQIFGQHELGSSRFQYVIDLVERGANQMQPKTAGLNLVVTSTAHLVGGSLLSVIAYSHSDASAQTFHRQSDGLVVPQFVGMTDNVRAGLIDAEHH